MRMNLKNLLWLLAAVICFASCSKEDIIEKVAEIPEGKIPVGTEIVIDGVVQSDTRAVSEAGYTTGDGLYDEDDVVTVAAVANDGYELVSFYDKQEPTTNLGSSHTFPAKVPQTFKAEFARKYTITVSANPAAGGTVAGGGTYRGGKTCTLTATANVGYVFDGWYEGSTKLSSNTSYSFTVSSNRTITGKFIGNRSIVVGDNGFIATPEGTKQVGADWAVTSRPWYTITYGNGKYVVAGKVGIITSTDGETWTSSPDNVNNCSWKASIYANGKFIIVGTFENYAVSTDGYNWTVRTTPQIAGSPNWNSITYGNGKYVMVGRSANGNYSTISTDGINWQTPTKIDVQSSSWTTIAYGNGKYIIAGGETIGNIGYIKSSTDGVNWTTSQTIGTGLWYKMIYCEGKFIGVGNSNFIVTSTDGAKWIQTAFSPGANLLRSIAYRNGIYVAVGMLGSKYVSSDGINWIQEMIKVPTGDYYESSTCFDVCIMP